MRNAFRTSTRSKRRVARNRVATSPGVSAAIGVPTSIPASRRTSSSGVRTLPEMRISARTSAGCGV